MTRLVLPILGIVLSSIAMTSSANAQGFEVAQKYSDLAAGPKVILSRPDMIHDAILTYEIRKPVIQNEIKRVLGKADLIANGISLYELNPRIGTTSFKFLSVDTFEVNVTGNYLYFRATQPTDLGAWADPAAEVHFDVRALVTLRLPTKASPQLTVSNATLSVPYIRIKGRNVAGDVVIAFAAINDFFLKHITGKSLIQGTFDRYLHVNFTNEINSELGPINKQIAALASKGFDPSYSLNGQVLRITMTGSLFKGPGGGLTSKASDAAKVLDSKVDPNAGHTLGKRKKKIDTAPLPGRETAQSRPRPRTPSVPNVLTTDSVSTKSDGALIGTTVEGRALEAQKQASSSSGMVSAAQKLNNAKQALGAPTLGKRKKPTSTPTPGPILMDPR